MGSIRAGVSGRGGASVRFHVELDISNETGHVTATIWVRRAGETPFFKVIMKILRDDALRRIFFYENEKRILCFEIKPGKIKKRHKIFKKKKGSVAITTGHYRFR